MHAPASTSSWQTCLPHFDRRPNVVASIPLAPSPLTRRCMISGSDSMPGGPGCSVSCLVAVHSNPVRPREVWSNVHEALLCFGVSPVRGRTSLKLVDLSPANRRQALGRRLQFWSARPNPAKGDDASSDSTSPPAHAGFRPDIEGLRAVAVLAVVLFHADVPGVGGGFIGVDVFFVISGFLITGLLWREVSTSGTVRMGKFYGARARRLLPASATVGIITAIGSALLLPPLQARSAIQDGIASALYVGNYWFLQHGGDYFFSEMPPSPSQHYWSLGVEEQFYLVWPVLIIGTAWLIRLVLRRNRAEATSRTTPYL